MILAIITTSLIGLIAGWQVRRAAHWHLVARILGRDVGIERAKRKAVSMLLADVASGIARGDAVACARAMHSAIVVAEDDTEQTLLKLGFKLPPRIA